MNLKTRAMFQDTLAAFKKCRDAIEGLCNDPAANPLSDAECKAAQQLADEAARFLTALAEYDDTSVSEMLENDSQAGVVWTLNSNVEAFVQSD